MTFLGLIGVDDDWEWCEESQGRRSSNQVIKYYRGQACWGLEASIGSDKAKTVAVEW